MQRRSFVSLGLVSAISALGLGRFGWKKLAAAGIPITLPASHMRDRVIAIRREIVSEYLSKGKMYPIPRAFYDAAILPTDRNMEEELARRGHLKVVGNTLVNQSAAAVNIPLSAVICDEVLKFFILFPKTLKIDMSYSDDHLELKFPSGVDDRVLITFINLLEMNLPDCGGSLIHNVKPRQVINRFLASNDKIVYELTSADAPYVKLIITLDLNASASYWDRVRSTIVARATQIKKSSWKIAILAVALMSTLSCLPGPPSNCKPCPTVGTTTCAGTRPGGSNAIYYIRRGSVCGPAPPGCQICSAATGNIPNLWSFQYIKDVPVPTKPSCRCSYRVCANEPIPPGWEAGPPYADPNGCDGGYVKNIRPILVPESNDRFRP